MTTYYMNPYSNTQTTPATLPSGDQGYGGIIKCITAQLTYASQLSGSVFVIGVVPAGSMFLGGELYTDTSTGSTTLAVGGTQAPTTASTALTSLGTFQANCYKAAAAITSTDLPTLFYSYASATHPFLNGIPQPYGYAETFKITTAAATAPSSGNLFAQLWYM